LTPLRFDSAAAVREWIEALLDVDEVVRCLGAAAMTHLALPLARQGEAVDLDALRVLTKVAQRWIEVSPDDKVALPAKALTWAVQRLDALRATLAAAEGGDPHQAYAELWALAITLSVASLPAGQEATVAQLAFRVSKALIHHCNGMTSFSLVAGMQTQPLPGEALEAMATNLALAVHLHASAASAWLVRGTTFETILEVVALSSGHLGLLTACRSYFRALQRLRDSPPSGSDVADLSLAAAALLSWESGNGARVIARCEPLLTSAVGGQRLLLLESLECFEEPQIATHGSEGAFASTMGPCRAQPLQRLLPTLTCLTLPPCL
jgi:hypothetical protein